MAATHAFNFVIDISRGFARFSRTLHTTVANLKDKPILTLFTKKHVNTVHDFMLGMQNLLAKSDSYLCH